MRPASAGRLSHEASSAFSLGSLGLFIRLEEGMDAVVFVSS